ncbi:MAG: DUF2806 domain-containing protein [Azonexaceae bacterium]|nr:DUF2806 domain-containing protein [Azonexaceae bacterium]
MDPSSNVDISVKVQANLDPLVNATPKGLSTLFTLIFRKRYPEAARHAVLSAAQNHVDSLKVLEGKATFNQENGALIEGFNGRTELRELVREALQEEEISNLISCTMHAASNMKDDAHTGAEVSPEFINRWRNEAKFISEEAAQSIWGRILSEEVSAPSSISIRTLDVIKNLVQEEAEAFREACKFVFFDQYLIDSTVDGNPVPYETYILLQDAGLLVEYRRGNYTSTKWPETNIGFETGPTKAYYLRVGNLFMYVEAEKLKEPPSVCYWQLTKAGKEMLRVISKEMEYDATALGEALAAKLPELKGELRYAIYTDTQKQQIDFGTIRPVFLSPSA